MHRRKGFGVEAHGRQYEHIFVACMNCMSIRESAVIETCRDYFGDNSHCQTVIVEYKFPDGDFSATLNEVTELLKKSCTEGHESAPVAVFVTEAFLMNMVACCYYQADLSLSDRFTIAGYCEYSYNGIVIPGSSTIEQPLEHMGRLATDILISRIEANDQDEHNQRKNELLSCKIKLI